MFIRHTTLKKLLRFGINHELSQGRALKKPGHSGNNYNMITKQYQQDIFPEKAAAKTASLLAAASGIVFFLLLCTVLIHGISQQYFELVRAPAKYTEEIIEHSRELNLIFVLDNIFIILYTSMACFTIKALRKNAPYFVAVLGYVLIFGVAILDFLENAHIYSLMQQAKNGVAVDASAITWQSAESLMKWYLAYFAFFMLGFLIPAGTMVEKSLKYSLWFLFLPVGVLVYAAVDTQYEALFQWLRFINLLSGFGLIWYVMRGLGKRLQ
jgi:hypothetical protein